MYIIIFIYSTAIHNQTVGISLRNCKKMISSVDEYKTHNLHKLILHNQQLQYVILAIKN